MIRKQMAKMKLRGQLMRAFKLGGIYKEIRTDTKVYKRFPKIHEVHLDQTVKGVRFTFTLPDGCSPDLVLKQDWVFKQCFGNFLEISGKVKKFVLWVYTEDLTQFLKYDYASLQPLLEKKKLPIVCGQDRQQKMNVLDMEKLHHMLLTGTTGSGKSSLIRAILTSLMLNKSEGEVKFLLGDLKFSEFGIYKRMPHVLGVCMDSTTLLPALKLIEKEMERRGQLLDKMDVEHISELPTKLPSIIVCIDEVILLKDNKKIMNIIESISCIGRSNGIYLLLSLQRGDSKALTGQLKNNLTFRMSGKQSDEINARISGLKQSANLDVVGRMVLQTPKGEKELQVPFMDKQTAKKLLEPLKKTPTPPTDPSTQDTAVSSIPDDIEDFPVMGGKHS